MRMNLKTSQAELAQQAGIHLQSIGKIESGKTTRLNSKSRVGLARALQIIQEYLDAVCQGVPVSDIGQQLKICPQCGTPGTEAEPMCLHPRSKFCFACETRLRAPCLSCNEATCPSSFASALYVALLKSRTRNWYDRGHGLKIKLLSIAAFWIAECNRG
uniref:helix-turn-helix domain-containing protein n=2 Tax=Cyanobacteriota TaxID=1117 RepID=UPI0030DB4531